VEPPRQRRFVPALGFHWLTALYDPLLALSRRERDLKGQLLARAALAPGMRVLDVGCGTGTLALWAAQLQPGAQVCGIDADERVLRRARRKLRRAGAAVAFERAFSDALPYADASFDRVLSSLFFHHLTRESKRDTLREIARVLKPGAELHVADFGEARSRGARWALQLVGWLDGPERVADHARGRFPGLLAEAGFERVERAVAARSWGLLELYAARRPG
jgi:cyclopropane fatty-acyl-phospholipid synthase-like methyltransferase